MGFLRLLLAISVVAVHSGPIFGSSLFGGIVSVKTFFIISGFYMSLILNEKYVKKDNSYKLFITNRFLRIFPQYWMVLIAMIIISLFWMSRGIENNITPFITYWTHMNLLARVLMPLVNVTIFGQELLGLFSLNMHTGVIYFNSTLSYNLPQLATFLFIPPTWTIGIELWFYVLAPFILKKKKIAFTVMGLSLLLFTLSKQDYRVLPTELFWFLLGYVSYMVYIKYKDKKINKIFIGLLFSIIIIYSLILNYIPYYYYHNFVLREWVFYIFITFALPFIFIFNKKNALDLFIGRLSYPVYIVHTIVVHIMYQYEIGFFMNKVFFGILAALFSIFIGWILLKFVDDPIDRYRQSRLKNKANILTKLAIQENKQW